MEQNTDAPLASSTEVELTTTRFEMEVIALAEKYLSTTPPLVLAQILAARSLDLAAYDARQYSAQLIEVVADQLASALAKRGISPKSTPETD